MSHHRIRLPAPWRATRSPAASTPASESSISFRRSFQRPTGLSSDSVVILEITLVEPHSLLPLILNVALNDKAYALQPVSDVVIQVPLSPEQLQPVNELEITVQAPAGVSAIEQPKFGQDYLAQVELVLS